MIGINKKLCDFKTESVAEIAVFAEGEAMYRARKSSKLATVCLSDIRRTLAECGAPYDIYSISDLELEKINDYKLYIFVNQYDMSVKTKTLIEEKCKKAGKTVLWLYAPDYANNGNLDVSNISKVSQINISVSNDDNGGLVYSNTAYNYNLSAPYFYIDDTNSIPLANFENGNIAAAYKEVNDYKSFYVATANLPSELLTDIARLAGVFVYSDNPKVYTYVNSSIIGVYNATDNECVISLKEDCVYKDLIEGNIYLCKNGKLALPQKDINAYLLVKEEIE